MEGNKDKKTERRQDPQGGRTRGIAADMQKFSVRLDSVRTPKIKISVVSSEPTGKYEERTLK